MLPPAYPDARTALADLVERCRPEGESLAALSRMIGRHAGYLDQFVRDGVPKALRPRDRQLLARYFNTDERNLGAENVPTSAERARRGLRP